jgi:hypothetical protein
MHCTLQKFTSLQLILILSSPREGIFVKFLDIFHFFAMSVPINMPLLRDKHIVETCV